MNLDIVLDWMKTYTGKITPNAIQRNFSIGIWYADRIYDMLVKGGYVIDEKRMGKLLAESKREAAEEMYEVLQKLVDWNTKYPAGKEYTNYGQICKIGHLCSEICKEAEDVLKKARGEKMKEKTQIGTVSDRSNFPRCKHFEFHLEDGKCGCLHYNLRFSTGSPMDKECNQLCKGYKPMRGEEREKS